MRTRVSKVGKKFHIWKYSEQGVFQIEEYLLLLYFFLWNQSQGQGLSRGETLFQGGCPSTSSRDNEKS